MTKPQFRPRRELLEGAKRDSRDQKAWPQLTDPSETRGLTDSNRGARGVAQKLTNALSGDQMLRLTAPEAQFRPRREVLFWSEARHHKATCFANTAHSVRDARIYG